MFMVGTTLMVHCSLSGKGGMSMDCLYCQMLIEIMLQSNSAARRTEARHRLHTHVKAEHVPSVVDVKTSEGVGL